MSAGRVCRTCRQTLHDVARIQRRRISSSKGLKQHTPGSPPVEDHAQRVRNIGIIAHIDAGKTTTTERMLYYSGFTRRIGDVDDGSTVTDFLPAERARGITIQSAAVTFHWPPKPAEPLETRPSKNPEHPHRHTINLIDTPGHADFTFEVIRSLRILDGAVCILDGVAGVEAQTEKVWHQASMYRIPRIIYVNKLDRDGAAFSKTIKEIASRLHTSPALCQIPWWKNGTFIGVGDVVELRALQWEHGGDGSTYATHSWHDLAQVDAAFQEEMRRARAALVEALTEQDEDLVESFLESNEDWLAIPSATLWKSLRKCLLGDSQALTPVFAGASFRNIGVQPLLNAVNTLLPSPLEAADPDVSFGDKSTTMRTLLASNQAQLLSASSTPKPKARHPPPAPSVKSTASIANLNSCALAFKVVNDARRGVLVYIRVYHGAVTRNALLYNTNLGVSERALRLLRMYASEAAEIGEIVAGQIGVITGLKHARTGDTLIAYAGASFKHAPPAPIDTLQLRPIEVPPPLFFASVEPNSLSEEKNLEEAMALLLREDPSLHVEQDPESGQTHLSGMGELHLEIARDRLISDFKVKATMGKIEIGYRETLTVVSPECTETFDREVAGKQAAASCTASVAPVDETDAAFKTDGDEHTQTFSLRDSNRLIIHHPTLRRNGKPIGENPPLPPTLSLAAVITALQNGASAALARGPSHNFTLHSTAVTINFDPTAHVTPTTSAAALASAARLSVQAALKAAAKSEPTVLMEPVMLATITMQEEAMGNVAHDLSAARGGHVLSLDSDDADEADGGDGTSGAGSVMSSSPQPQSLSSGQLARVYAPPDPFGDADVGGGSSGSGSSPQRQIKARVPLKEMVGYLKHLRSMTGGRGTFVMSVDRYERMTAQRQRAALAEMGASSV